MFEEIIHYYIPLILDALRTFGLTAIITACIETTVFAFSEFAEKHRLTCVFWANIISNVAINTVLSYKGSSINNILIGEALVVLFEFIVFYIYFRLKHGNSGKLLYITFLANLTSYVIGYFYFLK